MRSTSSPRFSIGVLALALAGCAGAASACGGSAAPPARVATPAAHPAGAGTGSSGGAGTTDDVAASGTAPAAEGWATDSWEERHHTMNFVVLPVMAHIFQEHEQKPYPTMTCRTCHGAGAEAAQYKMPNSALPPLDPAHMPDPKGTDRRARAAKFMIEEVTPKMIMLLEVEPYDARTKRGFDCFSCHPVGR